MFFFKKAFGPLETNAILIGCEKTKLGAIVDPVPGSAKWLLKTAEEKGLKIEKILLTHSHWDHFADAHEVKEKTGAKLFVHELDAPNIKTPGADNLPLFFEIHPVSPDQFVGEDDIVSVGELQFRVILLEVSVTTRKKIVSSSQGILYLLGRSELSSCPRQRQRRCGDR